MVLFVSLQWEMQQHQTSKHYFHLCAQCTPNLSGQNCSDCLVKAFGNILQCGGGKQGGRFHTPSCYFIFQVYPFYDTSYLPLTSPSPPPPPAVSSPPLNNTSATIGTSATLSLKHNRLGCNFLLNTCWKLIRIYSYIFKSNIYYTLAYIHKVHTI